ncbi:uncharacterized protein LOC134855533 [Symsagittifera roscoffensis]|uniref:uncharacterized protein LOC134855533 n=1 Tax=Symsagittifera roscoffensis TaxID=84072 RepID=UPI00307B79E6
MASCLIHFLQISLIMWVSKGHEYADSNWETLEFILPDEGDTHGAGITCYNVSDSFCLHGYWFNSVQSNRMCVQPDDLDTWTALIEGVWMNYNWFSFDSRSFGTCCNSQVHEYMSHGCNYGVSPQDYFDKVTDFSNQNNDKQLNRIKARYNSTSEYNIISELGFGKGSLVMDGVKDYHDFVLPPKLQMMDTIFTFDDVQNELTYDWFKKSIVCKGQPWLCNDEKKIN